MEDLAMGTIRTVTANNPRLWKCDNCEIKHVMSVTECPHCGYSRISKTINELAYFPVTGTKRISDNRFRNFKLRGFLLELKKLFLGLGCLFLIFLAVGISIIAVCALGSMASSWPSWAVIVIILLAFIAFK